MVSEPMQCNVIRSADNHRVKKFMLLINSYIYHKMCLPPIKEEYILSYTESWKYKIELEYGTRETYREKFLIEK